MGKNTLKTQKEPFRHHYIPQFIIRNFSNYLDFVNYYDKKRKIVEQQSSTNVFKYNDLYRDEVNTPNNPIKIEQDFSKYECEIAEIIQNKFLSKNAFELSIEENESLLLFLALQQFRSKNALLAFSKRTSEASKAIFSNYQKNGDFVSLWKRNLGHVVNCRSLKEVLENPFIDDPIKAFMARDTFGLAGMFIIVAERRGEEDFFLSDTYPLVQNGTCDNGFSLPLMAFYPISPSRIIIAAYRGIRGARQEVRTFAKQFFAEPYLLNDKKTLRFTVKKIYQKEISSLNDSMFENASEGVAFFDEKKFFVVERNII